ncbi:SH3 domain-containing protein [Muricoccus radiodurans]|uniref:SH3 domain-containing protein n=1 Tax=Muricoccus radiodurans TaxID=2231721 RepID=UPI003CF6DE3A
MPRLTPYALAATLTLALAAPASAAPGFATNDVNLRAGPGVNYPRVTAVPSGAAVEIFGCLDRFTWCDTQFGGIRGWVSGSYLQFLYEGRRVIVPEYAPRIGLPVVTYNAGDYFDRYYRGRPWYAERNRWVAAPPPAYAPPPPRYAGPPPVPPPGWRDPRWDGDRPDWREERERAAWREERRRERAAEWREDRERRLDQIQDREARREYWEERRAAREGYR